MNSWPTYWYLNSVDRWVGLDAIDSVENMEEEWKNGKLLRRDVPNLVSSITPYLPYLGFLSGGITVGKHVSNHMYSKATTQTNKSVGDLEIETKTNVRVWLTAKR